MRYFHNSVEKLVAWVTESPQFVADLPPHTKLGCFDAKESTLRELHGFPCIPEAGVSKYVAQLNIKFPFVVWGGNCQVLSELDLNCTACTALHCSSTLQSGKIFWQKYICSSSEKKALSLVFDHLPLQPPQ